MKRVYTLVSPSHHSLYERWFLPSLEDDYEIIPRFIDQVGASKDHRCGTAAFNRTMVEKAKLMLEAIEANMDHVFMYSDVDIQFFRSCEQAIDAAMEDYDVAGQQDAPLSMDGSAHPEFSGHLCAGFLVCRANERTRALWKDVLRYVEARPDRHDQHALNELLNGLTGKPCDNPYGVRWRYLPDSFFGPGPQLTRAWQPGQPLVLPSGLVMHHANWTIGVKNKVAQLQFVRDQMRRAA